VAIVHDSPVQLLVSDDLKRSRLTVFFRLLLAIPHLIWFSLWGIVALVAVITNWFATLIAGQSPQALHNFLGAYVRYAIHVGAYLFLAADPFPGFLGERGYPVDVEIAPPRPQNRWTVFFRLLLAVPALIIAGALTSSGARSYGTSYSYGVIAIVAFLGWFAAIALARLPRGLRDVTAYALAYSAQLDAYLFLLTDRYPNSDPLVAIPDVPVRGEDPIQLEVSDDLRRSRLTVLVRILLVIPHVLWLIVWTILAYLAAIVNWFATLIRGVSPGELHDFLASYVRYRTHVYAYLFLIANPYPGFVGRIGSYPVEPLIEGPRVQNRWRVFFRAFLALPASLIRAAYGGLLGTMAFLGWFASLVNGRMPLGMRNAGALALRYSAQSSGYVLLLTDSYPYSGPSLRALPASPDAPPQPLPGSYPQQAT
jgi:hypothetical protein